MEDKKITRNILVISAVVIALSIGIGFSFAYFTANVKGNEDAKENIVKAGKMEITYIDGSSISLDKMQPGESTTKKFKVQNTGNFPAKYNIKLDEVTNTLQDKTDLRYTLKKNGTEEKSGVVPSGNAYILTDISIDADVTDEYELKIEFVDTHTNQNDNQGKTYTGKIQIDKEENITLATNPEVKLYQGLIPVDFDGNGNVIVADTNDKWYDYTVSEWANAVLVNSANYEKYSSTPNKIIPMEDILQMYVYIPRYKYQLFNAIDGQSSEPQMINIHFENGTDNTGDIECKYSNPTNSETLGQVKETCTNKKTGEPAQNGEWYTHPAFTFGETELPGIWVGKFEPSEENKSLESNVNNSKEPLNDITILPNKASITTRNVSTMFLASRAIESNTKYSLDSTKVDTHMTKNSEWGAVAYLSQSMYGIFNKIAYDEEKVCFIEGEENNNCRIWINNTNHGTYGGAWDGTITGCSYVSVEAYDGAQSDAKSCITGRTWNEEGTKASTTGNMYGIYDMNGGMWERVMGNMVDSNGNFNPSYAGFTIENYPDSRYYDIYSYDEISNLTQVRGHLGDATKEVLSAYGTALGGWDDGHTSFLHNNKTWMARGGSAGNKTNSGIFAFTDWDGSLHGAHSFRITLTAQDGE